MTFLSCHHIKPLILVLILVYSPAWWCRWWSVFFNINMLLQLNYLYDLSIMNPLITFSSMGYMILLRLRQTPSSSELSCAHTSLWEPIEMLSALKKLVGSESGQLRERHIPAGLQSMNQSLQRRFAKGVQYNSEEFLQPLMMTCAFL